MFGVEASLAREDTTKNVARTVVCLFSSEYGNKYFRENRKYRGGDLRKLIIVIGFLLLWWTSQPKSTSRRKGLFHLTAIVHHPGISGQEIKVGIQGQELMQRPWKNNAHWLAPCGLFCLPSYSTLDLQSRGDTTHNWLGPSTSIINQENVLWAYPQINLLGTFFSISIRLLLPKWMYVA